MQTQLSATPRELIAIIAQYSQDYSDQRCGLFCSPQRTKFVKNCWIKCAECNDCIECEIFFDYKNDINRCVISCDEHHRNIYLCYDCHELSCDDCVWSYKHIRKDKIITLCHSCYRQFRSSYIDYVKIE